MKILIVYATTEGQTRKIARFAAGVLATPGFAVELLDAADAAPGDPADADAVILAGSVHAGRFQKSLQNLARAASATLASRPTLFLAVSLAAAGDDPEDRAGLDAVVAAFSTETGWTPGRVAHVAGAFRFTEYDFFKSWMMRRIAAEKGESVDPHADKEYTDWDALRAVLLAWRDELAAPA